jgi:hypothetical protein
LRTESGCWFQKLLFESEIGLKKHSLSETLDFGDIASTKHGFTKNGSKKQVSETRLQEIWRESHAHFEMDVHSRTAGLGERRRTAGV